jgi:hypothetical protein
MKQFTKILSALFFVSACGTPTPSQVALVKQAKSMSTYSLWSQQQYTQSALTLAVVEAELASRGETKTTTSYLGKRSRGGYGKRRYARTSVGSNTKNCSDFTNAAQAQRFFLASGGPTNDPNGLDRDGDGMACEWGTYVTKVARTNARAARHYTPRRYSGGTCYTGPRGGTYTITASGRKNYGGC